MKLYKIIINATPLIFLPLYSVLGKFGFDLGVFGVYLSLCLWFAVPFAFTVFNMASAKDIKSYSILSAEFIAADTIGVCAQIWLSYLLGSRDNLTIAFAIYLPVIVCLLATVFFAIGLLIMLPVLKIKHRIDQKEMIEVKYE